MVFEVQTMHNEEDPKWGEYAAACIRNILRSAGERAKAEKLAEAEEANRKQRVFTEQEGGERILWEVFICPTPSFVVSFYEEKAN